MKASESEKLDEDELAAQTTFVILARDSLPSLIPRLIII